MTDKIALIIPTKNRQVELERLLKSIAIQSKIPDQIIIVDGSACPDDRWIFLFPALNINYIHVLHPSLTKQRNVGLKALEKDIDLVCFLDDDMSFDKDALKNMLRFWDTADISVGGAVFNIVNDKPATNLVFIKSIFRTGCAERGRVLESGFNTSICPASKTFKCQWLFGGATVWRKIVFNEFLFDEWFEGYGFCEDLDFSFRVGNKYGLYVVADARIEHLRGQNDRVRNKYLGKTQILNRYHFISKDKCFFKPAFACGCLGHFLENAVRGICGLKTNYLLMALGNLHAFVILLCQRNLNEYH